MTDEYLEDDEGPIISKSQIKRELKSLRDLGKELVALTPVQLNKLPLSEDLMEDVIKAKSFKNKALKRQLQHIGVLIRDEDHEAIQAALNRLNKPLKKEIKQLHQLELWRDQLIAGDKEVLNRVIEKYDNIERQYLLQLIRNANKEKAQNKPPKSYRALFQYLQELDEKTKA